MKLLKKIKKALSKISPKAPIETFLEKEDPNFVKQVCDDCAIAHGGTIPEFHMPTWNYAKCDICGKKKAVTEPRDYKMKKIIKK